MSSDRTDGIPAAGRPPLFVVRGEASAEEVAALTVVLQGLAAAGAPPPARRASEWAAPHRRLGVLPSGAGGWRASALPR